MTEDFNYTGKEELDQQQAMPGYNDHIAGLFLKVMEPGMTLVDFGAGIGTISEIIRAKAKAGRLICVEIDKGNVDALKEKKFEVCEDMETLSQGSVDVVFSSNVLEHVDDQVGALKSLNKAMKSGGRAVFWVPAFNCLWTAMDDRVEHCRRYTRKTLEQAFEEAGFTVEKSFYQDSLGFFVTLLFKLIGNKDGTVSASSLRLYDKAIFPVSKLCDFLCSPFFGKNAVIYARKK